MSFFLTHCILNLWNELLLSDVAVTRTSVLFKLELQLNLDNATCVAVSLFF